MFEFLHKVLYVPNPKIKAATTIKGINTKTLVFNPIPIVKFLPIKLSHNYSEMIIKVPFVLGFCKSLTMSCGSKSDALSQLIARVLGQIN